MCVSRVNRMNIPCCHGNSICAPVRPLPHPSPPLRGVFTGQLGWMKHLATSNQHAVWGVHVWAEWQHVSGGHAWLPCASEHRAIFRSHDVFWLWVCERKLRARETSDTKHTKDAGVRSTLKWSLVMCVQVCVETGRLDERLGRLQHETNRSTKGNSAVRLSYREV